MRPNLHFTGHAFPPVHAEDAQRHHQHKQGRKGAGAAQHRAGQLHGVQHIPAVEPQKAPQVDANAAQQADARHRGLPGRGWPGGGQAFFQPGKRPAAQQGGEKRPHPQQQQQSPFPQQRGMAHSHRAVCQGLHPFHLRRHMNEVCHHVKRVGQQKQPNKPQRAPARPGPAPPHGLLQNKRQQGQRHVPGKAIPQHVPGAPAVPHAGRRVNGQRAYYFFDAYGLHAPFLCFVRLRRRAGRMRFPARCQRHGPPVAAAPFLTPARLARGFICPRA